MSYFKLLWRLYKLKSNTKKSIKRIEKLREKRLRKLLKYAYGNSKFYREGFQKYGITNDSINTLPLSAFPKINKKILLENFDSLITVHDITQSELRKFDENSSIHNRTFKGKYHIVHSSGSTGTPGYFLYDQTAWSEMLTGIIRAALWDMSMTEILKLLADKPRILYIAASDGRYGGAMAVGDGVAGLKLKQLHLDIKTPLAQWKKAIADFKPNIVIGYPSAMKILGELTENSDISLNLFRAVSCGEPLGASLRSYLECQFKCDVVNFYGASESLAMGVEKDVSKGMVLFDDMNIIEIENGRMYLTCLYNFAQPIIRYEITDALKIVPAEKNSRYPFSRAEGLVGRNEDILWFENRSGNREFLHPLAVEGLCVEGLVDYQFYQTGKDSFEMYAETSDSSLNAEIKEKILKLMSDILKEKKLFYVKFDVKFTDRILPEKDTGKKKLIVNFYKPEEKAV